MALLGLAGLVHAADGTGKLPADLRAPPLSPLSEHWSFKPVRRLDPPTLDLSRPGQNPIDAFILAKLAAKGLSLSRPSDRRTLIRRVSYDLTGLPPTQQEIDAFLGDALPDAFARVVDRLLASPTYGERWARHWLDVVRYADARDLIQLPAESDFREAWRYRDWVVSAHNRDLPYADFVRQQIAGDLLQPSDPESLDVDALVATGFLAIADFVPGDVDKDLMIADYVNDQLDVVGRSFLGLTLGCARCHDHKFDPISIEEYYGMAGILFSTRLIPKPVLGNTPLVRVPLLPRAELERIELRKKRIAEIEKSVQGWKVESEMEYLAQVERSATEKTAQYLLACWEYARLAASIPEVSLAQFAKTHSVHERILARWLDYFGLRDYGPSLDWSLLKHPSRGSSAGEATSWIDAWLPWQRALLDPGLSSSDRLLAESVANEIQDALVSFQKQQTMGQAASTAGSKTQHLSERVRLQAKRARTRSATDARVAYWPNSATSSARSATGVPDVTEPVRTNAIINGRARAVLRFDGNSLLEISHKATPSGSLFLVYRAADLAVSGQRLIGWEDADRGRHGIGLMLTAGGGVHAVLRKEGASGDIVAPPLTNAPFEVLTLTWGPQGATLRRQGLVVGTTVALDGVSSDPDIQALRIGGPGSGAAARFRGDLAELRVYDQPLETTTLEAIEKELLFSGQDPPGEDQEVGSPLALVYEDLCSPKSPFWLEEADRQGLFQSPSAERMASARKQMEALRHANPTNVPQAVVVQDGGPLSTRHEGFKDAAVYLRGNPKSLGKIVPRGFPKVLGGGQATPIKEGSGRLNLAEWIASTNNPLTARVAVNRIWQHHFGEGIVRTPSNFGQRGERPTHPELLDYLAARFMESGGSMKAMHRLILLSKVYQQSSQASAEALAIDPENKLWGRMNRIRLDAESIRDSLLFVAGRLNSSVGGVGFQDLSLPRRSLYLMSVRTGTKSGFTSIFDGPDGGSVVERRGVSTVAPQALFLMNDPFMREQAVALGGRIAREPAAVSPQDQIRWAYRWVFGRSPVSEEMAVGEELLEGGGSRELLDRYCQLLLCSNEFLYLD